MFNIVTIVYMYDYIYTYIYIQKYLLHHHLSN